MRYMLVPQIYWPVWMTAAYFEHSHVGMVLGSAAVIALWVVMWRVQFGTWRLGA